MPRWFACLIAALCMSAAAPAAHALDRFINQGPERLMISGYDTTAYFNQGAPRRGKTQYSVRWRGVTWRFASDNDAARFQANPTGYAPSFGAYCTGGLSQRHAVFGNPRIWRIHRGKLYLFATENGGRRFDRDPDGVIRAARAYWRTLPIREVRP